MRAVVQRVTSASVTVEDGGEAREVGRIGPGLLVFVGVDIDDALADVDYVVGKVHDLRIFEDAADASGRMTRSVADCSGAVLVVSQFTLAGDCRKGRRPSFDKAAPPHVAQPLYDAVVQGLRTRGVTVATGEFQAMMRVALVNDGPVTVLLDSRRHF